MIWYLLFQIIAVLVFTGLIYFWYTLRKDKLEEFLDFIADRIKIILYGYLFTILLVTILLIVPLWKTLTCQFDGMAANTSTSYSWYKGMCLYKSKTGAWLPLNISRDQPQGSDEHNTTDSITDTDQN